MDAGLLLAAAVLVGGEGAGILETPAPDWGALCYAKDSTDPQACRDYAALHNAIVRLLAEPQP